MVQDLARQESVALSLVRVHRLLRRLIFCRPAVPPNIPAALRKAPDYAPGPSLFLGGSSDAGTPLPVALVGNEAATGPALDWGRGVLRECVDEQYDNNGNQNHHPIRNLIARYRCFPAKPFHDFPPGFNQWLTRTSRGGQLSSPLSGTPALNRSTPIYPLRTKSWKQSRD